jgi:hypothetical protein
MRRRDKLTWPRKKNTHCRNKLLRAGAVESSAIFSPCHDDIPDLMNVDGSRVSVVDSVILAVRLIVLTDSVGRFLQETQLRLRLTERLTSDMSSRDDLKTCCRLNPELPFMLATRGNDAEDKMDKRKKIAACHSQERKAKTRLRSEKSSDMTENNVARRMRAEM